MTEPDRAWRTWIPLAVALASLALILPGLGRLDLWYDEAFYVAGCVSPSGSIDESASSP